MNNPLNDQSFPPTPVSNSPRLQAQLQQHHSRASNGTSWSNNNKNTSLVRPTPPPPKLLAAPRVSAHLLSFRDSSTSTPVRIPPQPRYSPSLSAEGTVKNPPLKLTIKVSPRSIKNEPLFLAQQDERSQNEIEAEEGMQEEDEYYIGDNQAMDVEQEEAKPKDTLVSSSSDAYPSLRTRLSAPSLPVRLDTDSPASSPSSDAIPPLKLPFLRCKCCSGFFLSRVLFDRHVNLNADSLETS